MSDYYLSQAEAIRLTGLSRTTIFRMRRAGEFPPPRQLTKNRIGYLASDITAWQNSRPPA